jgi:hypothetical protein
MAAFGYSPLRTLSLPSSVEYIPGNAFWGCSIESCIVDPANPYFCCENNFLMDKQSKTLIRFFGRDSHVLIPPGILTIGENALPENTGITSLCFADPSVTKLRSFAFRLSSLKSFLLPATVRKIAGTAFYDVPLRAFSIDDANPYFCMQGDCLIDRSTDKLICVFCPGPRLTVPSRVKIIGDGALRRSDLPIFTVECPDDSQLLRIEKWAFTAAGVVFLTLPQSIEFICGSAFTECRILKITIAPGNPHFDMRGDFLIQIPEQRLIRYFGAEEDVVVPSNIGILGSFCFAHCSAITSITFAEGSQLKAIEHDALRCLDLFTFRIPPLVERIHGSAFSGWRSQAFDLDERNSQFRIEGEFLLDSQGRTVIRYFGASSRVCIKKEVEVLGAGCFCLHQFLVQCDFEEGSRLREVREEAFWECLVSDVTLPSNVRYIGRKAFLPSCKISIPDLSAESQARLAEWEAERREHPSLVIDLRSS